MIKIPYGISDFETLRKANFFYQDRSQFIEVLEKWDSKYPVFLRPRRFGKSLFVSMLHYYYGVEHKEKFADLFDNLYIGQKPTASANSFLVLRFEFSGINTATHESTFNGFLLNVLYGISVFLNAYQDLFTDEQYRYIKESQTPEEALKRLFDCRTKNKIDHKIYLLIDEYDQFANELLSFDMGRFKSDVSQNGFVRKFYESIKTATGEGVVDRVFITGVSPITLDSLTSGFNITDHISTNPIFNDMMGFTHQEAAEMLVKADIPESKRGDMMADLVEWYDGYRFSRLSKAPLFNPDMLLYFLKEYSIANTYPDVMLDINIVSDYRKIRSLFRIGGDETERFAMLNELAEVGHVDFVLTRIFNIEQPFTDEDFLSLLYYMGMLTFQDATSNEWRCRIPNYVIKKLYFEYFANLYLENTQFARSTRPIRQTINSMINEAEPEAFFKIAEYVLQENHSNRDDMVYGEKHLQTLMIALLFPYTAYKIHSEYESKRGYPDIFLERVPDRLMNFEVVIELKYVKKSAAATVNKVVADAKNQLEEYLKTDRFARPDVRGFYCVFLGGEMYKWGKAGEELV